MASFLLVFLYLFTAYFSAVLFFFALSAVVPSCNFYARFLVALFLLSTCASYGCVASLALRVVGYGGLGQYTTARAFKWAMWLVLRVWVDMRDQERLLTRPAVFVGNHQTELDILLLGHIFPPYCSVSAKKSLKWYPFLGWFMWASNTVFIDRKNRASAAEALTSAASQIRTQRQSVWMFPEGTRSYAAAPMLLPFKKGAFHLAVQAQVPIVPVVSANYSNILHFQTRVFKTGTIPVQVLPAIETKGMTVDDVGALTERVRDMMLKELFALTEDTRGPAAVTGKTSKKTNGAAASVLSATGTDAPRAAKIREGI